MTRAPALAGRRNHRRGRWVRSPAPPTPALMRPRQWETPTAAHTPAHTCTCADTQDTCMHTPAWTRFYTQSCMHTSVYMYTYLQAYKLLCTHPPVYTCTPLYLVHTHASCIYMHTLASTHVYTHSCTCTHPHRTGARAGLKRGYPTDCQGCLPAPTHSTLRSLAVSRSAEGEGRADGGR